MQGLNPPFLSDFNAPPLKIYNNILIINIINDGILVAEYAVNALLYLKDD